LKKDSELVRESLEGKEKAFCEIVDRYRARIFSFILRMVKNHEEANDVAQDVFVKVFRSLDTYDARRNFSSWLFKIAQNMAIDHLRRRRFDVVSLDEPVETERGEYSIQVASSGLSPDRELEGMEVGEALEVAIEELEPVYRSAIMLRHVEGKSYDEIAEILEIPLGTVKTYIFRARRILRGRLKNMLPGHSI